MLPKNRWYRIAACNECFRLGEGSKILEKYGSKGEETGREREGSIMHTPLLNWNLKGNRFGASIKFELNRSSNLYFPKGGDSLPFVVSSSIHAQGPRPPPSREIGFPFRFPRFKSSRRDRGRGISRVTERTQEWHIDPEKGTRRCPLPPSFSLSFSLFLLRSIVPSLSVESWFRTFVRVHANFRSTRLHQTRGTRAPMGIGRRISSTPRASAAFLSLSRGISSYSDRVENGDIFPPKFPSPGIYRRDLDKLGTWTLCLERGFRNWPRANALLIAVHVGLKYSIGEEKGETFVWAPIARRILEKRIVMNPLLPSLDGIKY